MSKHSGPLTPDGDDEIAALRRRIEAALPPRAKVLPFPAPGSVEHEIRVLKRKTAAATAIARQQGRRP
jgi:hypothetical protein